MRFTPGGTLTNQISDDPGQHRVKLRKSRIDELAEQLNDVRGNLDRRGAEVDALQVEAARKARPFYKEPASVIAALALIGSIVATWLAQGSSYEERVDSQRARLAAVVKDIVDFQAEAVAPESGLMDYGIRPLVTEANLLVDALEGTAGQSQPFDKIVVASGYRFAREPLLAIGLAERAEIQSVAQNGTMGERVEAARILAQSLFEANRLEEGRAAYERARTYALEAKDHSQEIVVGKLYVTDEMWSESERLQGNCTEARSRLAIAQTEVQDQYDAARWQDQNTDTLRTCP
ncbi:hypothetical protein ACFPK1_16220 [Actinomycetospora rhizophila]|uniref:Uncharacterized protein n=1 Tax=Actinomycetospora rhizophila TaxID=1416876 RepID=A0ABV9ZHX8_9PSEU